MTLNVEDGTGLSVSDSYVSLNDCATYCTSKGLTFDPAASGAEAALRRATTWVDGKYRSRFPGYPTNFGIQALEWPRIGAYKTVPRFDNVAGAFPGPEAEVYFQGGIFYFKTNVVPTQVVSATCEAASRELFKPNSLAPDLANGGLYKSIKAGSVSIEFANNSTPNTVFQMIDLVLVSLLLPRNQFSGTVSRG